MLCRRDDPTNALSIYRLEFPSIEGRTRNCRSPTSPPPYSVQDLVPPAYVEEGPVANLLVLCQSRSLSVVKWPSPPVPAEIRQGFETLG